MTAPPPPGGLGVGPAGEPVPRLTVVVPARDAEATLAATLGTLVGRPDIARVVVVDDGSTDRTATIAQEAGATVVGGDGAGPAAARNRGMAVVKTELVAFCDADDDWIAPIPDPRLLALGADPGLDGAWGTTICRLDQPGAVDQAPSHLGALHGLVVRTAAWHRVGPFEPTLRTGEDVDWILRSRRLGLRVAMVDVPCYRYRLRSGSTSSGEGRRAAGLLAAVRRATRAAADGEGEGGGGSGDVAPGPPGLGGVPTAPTAGSVATSPAPSSSGSASARPAGTVSVAVVVPAADGERYLGEALASILGQVPRPASVVVGDDASTDDTVAVARRHGVAVVSLPSRQGPNAARMAALAHDPAGEGPAELVAFCDADDLWPAGRLATLVASLDADPDAAGVTGRVRCFASPDRDTSHLEVPTEDQPGVVVGALVVRRADLEAVGGLRTDLLTGEVVALERALAARGRQLAHIDDVVLHRRIHGDNLTVTRADEVRRAYLRLAVEHVRSER